jgi:hypothetical protein
VQCYSCCCRSSFYSLGRGNSNHPGTAFQDALDRPTETPSRESASHQMTHWLLKAGVASSFPLADAAGELMTHEGYTFRDALGKCVTVTPSCESASHQMIHRLLEAGFAVSFSLADAAEELKSPGSRVSRRARQPHRDPQPRVRFAAAPQLHPASQKQTTPPFAVALQFTEQDIWRPVVNGFGLSKRRLVRFPGGASTGRARPSGRRRRDWPRQSGTWARISRSVWACGRGYRARSVHVGADITPGLGIWARISCSV